MKRLVALLLFLPFAAHGTITRVQTKAGDTGSTANNTTLTVTLDNPTTAGNTVIATVYQVPGGVQTRASSTNGIWIETNPPAANSSLGHIFRGIMLGADTAITFTTTANCRMAAVVTEYHSDTGAGIITPDAIPSIASSTTATPATGALTNVHANALYVGIIGQAALTSATENTSWASLPSSPFSIVDQITTNVNNGTDTSVAFGEAIVSTIASRTFSASSSFGSKASAGVLATFYETSCAPTPTPTPTSTPTPTATATATSTATATFTPTATATASFTPCSCPPTPTATATFTPTATATATDTPTPTATATATATNTSTPTPTATATASFTPCSCPATPTATATFTPTATSTATATPTPTATATASYTPCICPATPTPTPTATATPTAPVETTGVFG